MFHQHLINQDRSQPTGWLRGSVVRSQAISWKLSLSLGKHNVYVIFDTIIWLPSIGIQILSARDPGTRPSSCTVSRALSSTSRSRARESGACPCCTELRPRIGRGPPTSYFERGSEGPRGDKCISGWSSGWGGTLNYPCLSFVCH